MDSLVFLGNLFWIFSKVTGEVQFVMEQFISLYEYKVKFFVKKKRCLVVFRDKMINLLKVLFGYGREASLQYFKGRIRNLYPYLM
jgi:hypothetical protein